MELGGEMGLRILELAPDRPELDLQPVALTSEDPDAPDREVQGQQDGDLSDVGRSHGRLSLHQVDAEADSHRLEGGELMGVGRSHVQADPPVVRRAVPRAQGCGFCPEGHRHAGRMAMDVA
jgi:hypothetical protein